ncbi:hypothetical protein AGABI1DRAFT_70492 [Agaricus bisporus var. burnettii JB137-S8]|uniref:Protein BFR2 n=1 Tax=Agaricus bisporus var. burnettii (strain JB137-S8 / ATCC MYA-4627 / FGSC 10392) TaxID=597362 RepID=K5Y262_AGABU|nr:uncharacterized protein AGABI1DRAFT_70492 [Agaricus bisporus var. burnettii JB137-S8]EKM81940.1 hypothetical protein AGABI1DRAFT_70492 [Agaricus bisporus var. burnettii JB137-S8]
MAVARLSLAQQLAQLDEPAPVDYDPEDLTGHERQSDDEGRAATSAGREHYFEVGPSTLRKSRDSIADPKYEGVKTSRRKLMESEDEEDNIEDQDEESSDDDERIQGEQGWDDEIPSDSEQEGDQQESEIEAAGEERIAARSGERKKEDEPTQVDHLSNVLRKTREEDLKKGKALVRQLNIWDALLDARIRLQKAVTTVNKIASSRTLSESQECQEGLQKYLEESVLLAEDLFELQETLLAMNENIAPPPRKRRRVHEDDDIQKFVEYFSEASMDTVKLEQTLHPWLVQTLAKWSTKIQAVAPSVLLPSNRNAFSKNSNQVKSAVQLVDEVLLDHSRLVNKTRVVRGKVKAADEKEEDPEVFDDTDFYQQLLRDVIESRGEGAGGADDWMALQREKKAKKKVDTKASKGRKLRYEVHEKLQNFMVSVPVVGAWHEEQIDELFASLLGKGFGVSATEDGEDVTAGGFRVFG